MYQIKLWGAMHLKREPVGYHLFREQGQDAINFVHFLSPVGMRLNGETIDVEANACIIYTPGFLQEYYAQETGFINNFVTFRIDTPDYLSRYNLPLNEVFYIEQEQRITDIVEYISWTMTDPEVDHTEDVRNNIDLLFRTLSEIQILNTPRSQRAHQTKKRFLSIRAQVQENPGAWDVEKMARAAFFTRSYFYTQYKAYFGVSPSEDLIDMTLSHARRLLLHTDEAISAISQACGYERVEYFIRLFKQKMGMTPGQYRRMHQNGQEGE